MCETPESDESAAPAALRARLDAIPLFAGLDEAALSALAAEIEWFCLPAGATLLCAGEPGDALYIVDSGCLAVTRSGPDGGGAPVVISEIRAGETVGEMALLSGEPRSATVVAWRDTQLLRLDAATYHRLLDRHPVLARYLAELLARRLRQLTHYRPAVRAPQTLTLVPLGSAGGGAAASLASALTEMLTEAGRRVRLVTGADAPHLVDWFHAVEAEHDLTIFRAEPELCPWTRFCLRQADRILLVARSGEPPTPASARIAAEASRGGRCFDLALLHDIGSEGKRDTATAWLDRLPGLDLLYHVRPHRRDDLGRFARLAAGGAVGLVLAGGGARSFAHIGVIRALRAAGIPLDLVGGTSMGAVIAAAVAMDWDDDELRERLRGALVDSSPVDDYTFPVLALAKGAKVERRLREHFGDTAIEELWRPFFCVSSSLTSGREVVHRRGRVWRALRASIAIPGLLPPVVEAHELLADGGIVNNFPANIMRGLRRGPVIGVNVVADHTPMLPGIDAQDGWQRPRRRFRWTPPIIGVLVRAGTMTSDAQVSLCRGQADLLIEPPLAAIDLLDWRAFDRAVEIGYRSAMESLERRDRPLFAVDRSGPAPR